MFHKKIIHIDMDAFYASVEQRDYPEFRGKPLIVARSPEERGVVAAASYEARQYGIHSAMPSYKALQLCPHVIFRSPRFDIYRKTSSEIRGLMQAITSKVEPLSLDEAYLDVSDCKLHGSSATRIAEDLRSQIYKRTGLTASAGVSYNKMLAKIASDLNKPNGIAVITPEQGANFVANLPIEHFYGIGKATSCHMHKLGIKTGADLRRLSREQLQQEFGKSGEFYYFIARGIDLRPVEMVRERKSIGSETTFIHDIKGFLTIYNELLQQNEHCFAEIQQRNLYAYTITIKLKFSNFRQITRQQTLTSPFIKANDAAYWIRMLLTTVPLIKSVRLVGVTYSGFYNQQTVKQLTLL